MEKRLVVNILGQFSYDSSQDELILDSFDTTLTLCDFQSHNEFETDYFGYFINGIKYAYQIYTNPSTNDSYLTLSMAPGFDLVYHDFPLDVSDNKMVAFKIFPNPASETLFIASEKEIINNIFIYSITGNKVFEANALKNSLDVSSLSKGIYFMEVETARGKSIQKFIKK